MSTTEVVSKASRKAQSGEIGWREFYQKEDWWAIWLGLAIVLTALIFFLAGGNIKSLGILPPAWDDFGKLLAHFGDNALWYGLQFVLWLSVFSVSTAVMGLKTRQFIPSFILVYLLSMAALIIGQFKPINTNGFEPPLVALLLGLIIGNTIRIPAPLATGLRVEYYIKTGIVLLGATLPFTLIVYAGPLAIIQATIISITTCAVIYFIATRVFKLEKPLSALLGVGAAVCGVSAAIAVGGAVKAKKQFISVAITLVIVWAIVMIVILPFASKALNLDPAVAGAWIGTSEFADAAGLAAASSYDAIYNTAHGVNSSAATAAFTLMKVVGRDIWIGVWAFIFALIAITQWDRKDPATGERPKLSQIWQRFPKFVLGFLLASLIITLATSGYSFAEYNKTVKPQLVAPISNLRLYCFIFSFLSIGLTTRFRDLASAGWKSTVAFSAGVVVNVILGFILSVWLLHDQWISLIGH
ncbi:MAG TPA: putative sulfate exporter family transporter [Chloroflexia bacterium]|nr:putative sulfate exporter family transporter [Chloroflexia bacterium]